MPNTTPQKPAAGAERRPLNIVFLSGDVDALPLQPADRRFFAEPVARSFMCRYQLRNGSKGALPVIAATSCDAVIAMIDRFGDRIKRLSARPV